LLRLAQGLAQQHVALLGLLAGNEHVGFLVEAHVDGVGVDEGLDFHRLVAFRRGRGDVGLLDHDVVALVVLEGLDDLLPGHFLAGRGVDPLGPDRVAVARVEHAEGEVVAAGAGHQRDRHIEQAEAEVAGPDRSGHAVARGWIGPASLPRGVWWRRAGGQPGRDWRRLSNPSQGWPRRRDSRARALPMCQALPALTRPSSSQRSGIETGAPARARTEKLATLVAPRPLRSQSMKIRPLRRRLLAVAT